MSVRRILPNVGEIEVESDEYPPLLLARRKYHRIGLTAELFIQNGFDAIPSVSEKCLRVAGQILVELESRRHLSG
jgi:hypothetical protein